MTCLGDGALDVYVYSVPGKELIEITNYEIELVKEVEYDTDIGILYSRWRFLGSPLPCVQRVPEGLRLHVDGRDHADPADAKVRHGTAAETNDG